MDEVGYEL